MTNFTDETLTCCDCNNPFVFTAGEKEFFHTKGFTNIPKRCPDCRAKKKADRPGSGGGFAKGGKGRSSQDRKEFDAVCTTCGAAFKAPFEPKPDRSILCRDCFKKNR